MLNQISESSVTVTPYGSLPQVHNVGSIDGPPRGSIQALSFKLLCQRICTLPIAVVQKATKTH
jgi:hypothetical protein